MSMIFMLILRAPPLGTNFQIFYATGFLVFNTYRDMSGRISNSIRGSRSLLRYPSVTYIDAVAAKFIISFVTQLIVMTIVLVGIQLVWETRTHFVAGPAILAVFSAAILGLGIGTLNCLITAYFPTWGHLWNVVNRPLVLMSGVIYLHDKVPQPYQDWLWWNPLVHVVGQMRRAFYPQYVGDYVTMAYPIGVGLVCLAVGLLFLNRYNRHILTIL